MAKKYFSLGVDVITGGNHSWNFAPFRKYLDQTNRILRPANYPDEAPGKGATSFKTESGLVGGVLNLQGRTCRYNLDCPFKRGLGEVERVRAATGQTLTDNIAGRCKQGVEKGGRLRQRTNIIFVEVQAEATAEKIALGWYLDGKVSALVGTHTHVQTADERILPKGTAYITDVGMTGPHDSVIGLSADIAIKRFISGIPEHYQMATSNNRINGVVIDVDSATGRAVKMTRINLP